MILDIFISKLGEPNNKESLLDYINLTQNEYLGENYSELHHILPRSVFPEFLREEWNIIRLEYTDHIKAHFLLAEAYKIPKFILPTLFMNDNIKSKEGYNHSEFIKICMNTEETKFKISEGRKLQWALTSDDYKEYFSQIISMASQKRWNDMPSEKREEFKQKMLYINSNTEKRLDVGIKIKEKWNEPLYIEKQKASRIKSWTEERKENHKKKMREKWNNVEYKEKLRKSHLDRPRKSFTKNKIQYIATSPENKIYEISNLSNFCKEYNLNNRTISKFIGKGVIDIGKIDGRTKENSINCNGWKIDKIKDIT